MSNLCQNSIFSKKKEQEGFFNLFNNRYGSVNICPSSDKSLYCKFRRVFSIIFMFLFLIIMLHYIYKNMK